MDIISVLASLERHCYFLTETDARIMINNGYGGLPVLIRRNLGREVVRLRDLEATLAKPMEEFDYLRDVSTWPEMLEAIQKGTPEPAHRHLPRN